jgi:hypothetical protein
MDTDVLTADEEIAADLDDALLNILGSGIPSQNAPLLDDELNALLLAWRNEVEARPIPELVDTPTAIDTIKGAAA